MPFELFDRSKLELQPLGQRQHDMSIHDVLPLDADVPAFSNPNLDALVDRIVQARREGAPVILMLGAHVIKCGLSRFLITLLNEGIVTHFALNGAGAIHDFELGMVGATTESVARYIKDGQFGLWQETGGVNEAAKNAVADGIGFGEALGRMITNGDFPHKELSLLAAGYQAEVPVTVHVGIGCDIVHEHPNCDGAALGQATYTDFLIYAHSISQLEGGVFINLGSAVIGPEVYLKCLSMARNVARQEGRRISRFTTAVFDLLPLTERQVAHEPPKSQYEYYFRPLKTILVRTVEDGGESFYVQGDHRITVPHLVRKVMCTMGERRVMP